MKKFFQEIFNKWVVGIKDSTMASEFMIKTNHRLNDVERRNLLDSAYLDDDYRTLEKLKTKTK